MEVKTSKVPVALHRQLVTVILFWSKGDIGRLICEEWMHGLLKMHR